MPPPQVQAPTEMKSIRRWDVTQELDCGDAGFQWLNASPKKVGTPTQRLSTLSNGVLNAQLALAAGHLLPCRLLPGKSCYSLQLKETARFVEGLTTEWVQPTGHPTDVL